MTTEVRKFGAATSLDTKEASPYRYAHDPSVQEAGHDPGVGAVRQ
jgi:hypothetical protein